MNRLGTLMQMTVTDDFSQRANDVRFGLEIHRQVRAIPVAKHAETDKIFFLAFHLLGGIGTAGCAEFSSADLFTRLANHLLNFVLNRQTVAVPARHIR